MIYLAHRTFEHQLQIKKLLEMCGNMNAPWILDENFLFLTCYNPEEKFAKYNLYLQL